MNAVLTNQYLPILLILIAVYILMNIDYNKNVIIKSIIIGLLLGFNYETNGMYSETDAIICAGDKEKAIEVTKERIKEYKKIPILFVKKHKILWLNSDLYWPLGYIANSNIYKITNIINQIFIYILYFSSVLSIIILIKNKFEQNQFLIQ